MWMMTKWWSRISSARTWYAQGKGPRVYGSVNNLRSIAGGGEKRRAGLGLFRRNIGYGQRVGRRNTWRRWRRHGFEGMGWRPGLGVSPAQVRAGEGLYPHRHLLPYSTAPAHPGATGGAPAKERERENRRLFPGRHPGLNPPQYPGYKDHPFSDLRAGGSSPGERLEMGGVGTQAPPDRPGEMWLSG